MIAKLLLYKYTLTQNCQAAQLERCGASVESTKFSFYQVFRMESLIGSRKFQGQAHGFEDLPKRNWGGAGSQINSRTRKHSDQRFDLRHH